MNGCERAGERPSVARASVMVQQQAAATCRSVENGVRLCPGRRVLLGYVPLRSAGGARRHVP
eukprot:3221424-Prymnesium_polylepis.2